MPQETSRPSSAPGENAIPVEHQKPRIEIYADESFYFEDPTKPPTERKVSSATVGGLAAIFPNKGSADSLMKLLRDEKLVWGFDQVDGQSVPPESEYVKKRPGRQTREYVNDNLGHLTRIAKNVAITAFALTASEDMVKKANRTQLSYDWLYRQLLRRTLECLLSIWPKTQDPNVEVAVYAGTRVDFGDKIWAQSVGESRGIRSVPQGSTEYRGYTFSCEDVAPLVDAIRAERRRVADVKIARGVRLLDYQWFEKKLAEGVELPRPTGIELPRQLHFVADWVASYPDFIPNGWWDGGFRENADVAFDRLVQGSRAAEIAESCVDALTAWWRAGGRVNQRSSVARWVKGELRACATNLDGESFIRLCNRLR